VGIGHGLRLFGSDGLLSCDDLRPNNAPLADVLIDRCQAFKAMKAR
jgi:hypothetical protein